MSNYYIVGTKYGTHNNIDIMPSLLSKNVIAIGFAGNTNLTEFFNQNENALDRLLTELVNDGQLLSR